MNGKPLVIILASIFAVLAMIIPAVLVNAPGNASASLPAHIMVPVTLTNYTYQDHTGTFALPDSPSYAGATVGHIQTDWGNISLGSGANTLADVMWGSQTIPAGWYDVYMNYWHYNASGIAGRPFAADWGSWYKIRNDSYMAVYQRSAQSPSVWSGVDEWNVTVRVGILKHDPYVRLDGFIRFVNPSSLIKNFDCNPVYYWLPGYAGLTRGVDYNRHLSWITADSGAYAIGQVGQSVGTELNVGSPIDFNLVNRTQKRMTENFHFASVLVLGQNLSDLNASVDNLGSVWNHHEENASYNLLVAKNGDKFDTFDYFPATGYKINPSGTSETIIAQNASTTVNHFVNPILNYARLPVITDVDDHQYAEGDDATWDWLYATARTYSMSLTFPSYFANTILQHDINSYVNKSTERHGTLFEIADHGYNHTSFYGYQAYPYAGATYNLSKAKWSGNTSIPLISETLPYNAYSYNTWDSLGAAGVKNLRLTQAPASWNPPFDYNVTGSPIWVKMFQCIAISATPGAAILTEMKSYGYYYLQGHENDFDTPGERTAVAAWFSWVQNESDVISVTHSQFSDLWHHRVVYSTVDGRAQIALTTAQTNHRLFVNTSAGARAWWDTTSNTAAYTSYVNASTSYFDAVAGHVYVETVNAAMTLVGSQQLVLSMFQFNPGAYAPGAMGAYFGATAPAGAGNAVFVVLGLPTNIAYDLIVDGILWGTMNAASAGFTITFTGTWSFHKFGLMVHQEPGGTTELVADFSYTVKGNEVKFDDASTGLWIESWSWSFDDGRFATNQDPTHSYAKAGTYRVQLIIQSLDGQEDTITKTVVVGSGAGVTITSFLPGFDVLVLLGAILIGVVIIAATRRPGGVVVGAMLILAAIVLVRVL